MKTTKPLTVPILTSGAGYVYIITHYHYTGDTITGSSGDLYLDPDSPLVGEEAIC